jgi:NAD(P)-dependent dehydrogenase (short-subunit alcohol dehydrogenase family)
MPSQSSRAPALSGKVAIVTGGGTGIGLAIARMFVDEGAQVVIAGRSQVSLDQAAAGIGARLPRASAVSMSSSTMPG